MAFTDDGEIDYNMLKYWYDKHGDLSQSMGDKIFRETFEEENPVLFRMYKRMIESKEEFEAMLSAGEPELNEGHTCDDYDIGYHCDEYAGQDEEDESVEEVQEVKSNQGDTYTIKSKERKKDV